MSSYITSREWPRDQQGAFQFEPTLFAVLATKQAGHKHCARTLPRSTAISPIQTRQTHGIADETLHMYTSSPPRLSETHMTYSSKAGASITSTKPLRGNSDQGEANGEKQSTTKGFLEKMKEENERRKEKVLHVSHEEAEQITGYGEKSAGKRCDEDKSGKGASLATLLF